MSASPHRQAIDLPPFPPLRVTEDSTATITSITPPLNTLSLSDDVLALPTEALAELVAAYVALNPASAIKLANAAVPFHGTREEAGFWREPWEVLATPLQTILQDEDGADKDDATRLDIRATFERVATVALKNETWVESIGVLFAFFGKWNDSPSTKERLGVSEALVDALWTLRRGMDGQSKARQDIVAKHGNYSWIMRKNPVSEWEWEALWDGDFFDPNGLLERAFPGYGRHRPVQRPSTKSRETTPRSVLLFQDIPPELILDILELGAVAAEFSSPSLEPRLAYRNHFLCTASLVCRAWRGPSQRLLLSSQPLRSAGHARRFVEHLEATGGSVRQLTLQVGDLFSNKVGEHSIKKYSTTVKALESLWAACPNLSSLQLQGSGIQDANPFEYRLST
ncbi:hypothetical protein RQP46_007444 [Phenoliferia psychrophenolica]